MKKTEEYLLIVKRASNGIAIYNYAQDLYDNKIFWYKGCVYEFNEKPIEEVILKAAIRGNVRFFRLKKYNFARGVVFEDEMEFVFE